MQRKPSHFGSKINSAPAGSASRLLTPFDNIGATGGMTGRSTNGQTTGVTDQTRAAGWEDDPSDVGELRYYDGQRWTEHVTIEGVQTMVKYDPGAVYTNPGYTVTRPAGS